MSDAPQASDDTTDDELVMLAVRIPKDLKRRLKTKAVDFDTTIQSITQEALEYYLVIHLFP